MPNLLDVDRGEQAIVYLMLAGLAWTMGRMQTEVGHARYIGKLDSII